MRSLTVNLHRTASDGCKWTLQGYFQTLFSCIEKLLAFLNVKNFVLPATDEATSIWTEKFGFRKIPKEQVHMLFQLVYAFSTGILIMSLQVDLFHFSAFRLPANLLADDHFQGNIYVRKSSSEVSNS